MFPILILIFIVTIPYLIYKDHLKIFKPLIKKITEKFSKKEVYSLTEKGISKPLDALCQCLSSCKIFCDEIRELEIQYPSSDILKRFNEFLSMTLGNNIDNLSDSNYNNNNIVQQWRNIDSLSFQQLFRDILNTISKDIYQSNSGNTILIENHQHRKFPSKITVETKVKCENCKNELLFTENLLSLKIQVPFKHEISDFTLQNLINNYFEIVELENFECSLGKCVDSVCKLSRFVKDFPKTICIEINTIHWNGKNFKESRKKFSFSDKLILKQQFFLNDLASNQRINDRTYSLRSMITINGTNEIVTRLWNGKWYQINNGNISIINDHIGLIPTILFYEYVSTD